jgi:hypothetical protein
MTRRTLVLAALIITMMSSVRAIPVHADSGSSTSTGSGNSIVEQIGCDETVVDPTTGAVTVNRTCQITDFVNLFVYLSKWGLSILAILAVGMIIYGGTQFITAAGRASKVDEGKRVINGTIIGSVIALTAYIIINSAVTAITGTTITSRNPFGVIASVFGSNNPDYTINGQTILRPFSGTPQNGGSGSTTIRDCRKETSDWDRDCSADKLLSHCADPSTGRGPITAAQEKLNAKGCDCSEPDGCFGPLTTQCVRRFQLANLLPATGIIDSKTLDLINNGGKSCTDTSSQNADAVLANLPKPVLASAQRNDLGCCVVSNGANDLYCLDSVSSRGCQALGGSNAFLPADSSSTSGRCASIPAAAGRCGFCTTTNPSLVAASRCYQNSSPFWCAQIGKKPNSTESLYYNNGLCDGQCASCTKSLMISPK